MLTMDWIDLNQKSQLEEIIAKSKERPQLIFKHSTRCSVSSIARNRLNRSPLSENIDFYYLDLLKYRDISQKIESLFNIRHQSPQVISIRDGKAIYNESHTAITMEEIEDVANEAVNPI